MMDNMKNMKKQDLETGDIVVARDGSVGIVIAEKEVIIYPESGMDFYWNLTDDLLLDDDYRGGDIVAVYRDKYGTVVNFVNYEDHLPIYERQDDVVWTSDMHWKNQQKQNKEVAAVPTQPKKTEEYFCGVIQALYGNRNEIEFSEKSVDKLILGHMGNTPLPDDWRKIDRSFVHIPGEEGLVFMYNKYEEERKLRTKEKLLREDGYVLKPLAEVPELDVKLYSRCLACRVKEDGRLESLREEDYPIVMKYLAE